jgi:leader peptidase (prepilin peptidase) / N-methyltransferase
MEEMPVWITYVASLAFGLAFGSFLNVVVVRLPQSKSLIKPGSHCPYCKKDIRWWENIPVFSYLLLGGRCKHCKKEISIRYLVIEILTAVLFLSVRIRYGWAPRLFFHEWPFICLLVAITFIDLEHRIIPDVLSLGGLIFGLGTCWLFSEPGWFQSVLGAIIGFSFFYALAWIYHRMTGRSGLGGGDIKLLAMLGSFLGPSGVFATILISSIFGSTIGIVWGLATGRKNMMKLSIPFGPFLVVGGLYYYLLGDFLWFRFIIPM